MEKSAAMTPAEKAKYLKYMITAAVASAVAGAVSRNTKYEEDRKKKMDPESSKNAIIVPIRKSKFLEGVMTPEEQAKLSSEATPRISLAGTASNGETPALADLAARKKEILRGSGRKVDYFGKLGKYAQDDNSEDGKKDVEDKATQAEQGNKDNGGDKDGGRVLLRDQSGKFVSPTDPVAVAQIEKSALDIMPEGVPVEGWTTPLFHPWESIREVVNSATGKPLAIAGGMIGSIILAEKISDIISKRRKEKSKELLDEARGKYVSLLEESKNEKAASTTVNSLTGNMIGGAFFIPMALTAIITKKIIDNRREEKKRQKEMADSYPEEPLILYKTSEGKDLEIDAGTALMAIMCKRAMILDAERSEIMEKTSQVMVPNLISPDTGVKAKGDERFNAAMDFAKKQFMKDENRGNILKLIKAYNDPNVSDDDKDAIKKAIIINGDKRRAYIFKDLINTPEFKRRLAMDKGVQDYMVNLFNTDPEFKAYKNQTIDENIAKGLGIQSGGMLHKIIAWLAKNLGIGDWMFNRGMRNRMGAVADRYAPKPQPNDAANNGQGAVARGEANVGASGRNIPIGTHPDSSDSDWSNPEKVKDAYKNGYITQNDIVEAVNSGLIPGGGIEVIGPDGNFFRYHNASWKSNHADPIDNIVSNPSPYIKNESGEIVPNPDVHGQDPAAQAKVQSAWSDYVAGRNTPKTAPTQVPQVPTGAPPVHAEPPHAALPSWNDAYRTSGSVAPREAPSLNPPGIVTSMPVHPSVSVDFDSLPKNTPLAGEALDTAMDKGYVPQTTPMQNQGNISFQDGDTQGMAENMYRDADLRP